ncbi:MAG: Disulfide bond formation protein D precursor [Parcubacteria group bacterium ADurb.Bin316]|nr:MAG: Disulfide bond formation protein D precursor [Parcubacteria group bacterium ADurb.Bin316]HOZ56151.1 DsbA family protein [bacterium]
MTDKTKAIWRWILFPLLILILGFVVACTFYILNLLKTGEWQKDYSPINNQKISTELLQQITKDNYWLGAANPKITIIEFADFSCSMCKNSFLNIREISVKYKNDVRIIFKDFPVISASSPVLALAARCAGEQGLFWPMHDKLYINQGLAEEKEIIELAKQIGTDATRFTSCLQSKKYAAQVNQDYEDGIALKVSGTPTWFINDKKYTGDIPHDTFIEILEQLLKQ